VIASLRSTNRSGLQRRNNSEITLSHRIEPDPIVRLAIHAAVRLKAHFLSIVSTEFVAEELAV